MASLENKEQEIENGNLESGSLVMEMGKWRIADSEKRIADRWWMLFVSFFFFGFVLG